MDNGDMSSDMQSKDSMVVFETTEQYNVVQLQNFNKDFVEAQVFLSPLPGTEPMRVKARIGSLVRDILPECARAPMVCIIDGVPMKREWWMQRPVCEGDKIQFAPVYLGGGNSRSILGAIAAIALTWFAPQMVAGWGGIFTQGGVVGGALTFAGHLVSAGIILIGNALISAVIGQPTASNGQGDTASSIYSVDTQGNAARIFQPIPVQYGRMKYYPNYAAQPYVMYHTSESTLPTAVDGDVWGDDADFPDIPKRDSNDAELKDGEQFYYALFCLGQGEYDIEAIKIADSPISSFDDIRVARILPPGERPRVVDPCVVSSDAVSGISLDGGDWIGPFPCCGPGRRITSVDVDLIFPQGLCKLDNNGKAKYHSVRVIGQAIRIDDRGKQEGNWTEIFNISISAATLTPQRRTFSARLEGRWQVRMMRIGKRDEEDQRTMDSVQWGALRGHLDSEATLCKTATHFELVMRASKQLSSLSQRKISILATRKLSSWDDPTPTSEGARSPARALWDKWTNKVYGDGLPLDRIDVEMLKHYDTLCKERGDNFDYVFESRVSSQEADQTIAKVMRCVALQRQGVKTIVRDELCDMPLTLFNPTNIAEKSVSLDYIQITEETTDGVIAEYFSDIKWDWEEVECPGPGRTYSDTSNPQYNPALPVMENPARITLNGITHRKHAEREGLYYAYTNALRRQFATWTTELQGALVYYGAPVLLSTTLYASQQGGEVRDYDAETNLMELTNEARPGKLVLMRNDGSLTEPLEFSVVAKDRNVIQLVDAPDFVVNYGDYASERTKYIILEGDLVRRIVKILAVTPKGIGETGAPLYELKGVVDVPEVHTVDNFLLVPDDPYNPPDIPDEPDIPVIPDSGYTIVLEDAGVVTYQALYPNTGYPASIVFFSDGAARTRHWNGSEVVEGWTAPDYFLNHWVKEAAAQGGGVPNVGELYEIIFIGRYDDGSKLLPIPSQEFLDNPNRDFMQGYKLKYKTIQHGVTFDELDTSTAAALSQAFSISDIPNPDIYNPPTLVYTDWIPITNPNGVELRGWWDTKPHAVCSPTDIRQSEFKHFYVAIRDKTTHTMQAFAHYYLGVWRKVTGSLT